MLTQFSLLNGTCRIYFIYWNNKGLRIERIIDFPLGIIIAMLNRMVTTTDSRGKGHT